MKVTSGYPQVFHVLPHEKAYLADEAIERIRAQDKYLRASLPMAPCAGVWGITSTSATMWSISPFWTSARLSCESLN